MKKIALQLYSVEDAMETDLLNTLNKVSEIGYRSVQFAGFNDVLASAVK